MVSSVGERLVITSPATGAVVGEADCSDPAAMPATVDAAREAGRDWEAMGFAGRTRVLLSARRLLAERAESAIATIVAETGKPWEDAQSAELTFGLLALGFGAEGGGLPMRAGTAYPLASRSRPQRFGGVLALRRRRGDQPLELPAGASPRGCASGAHGR